MVTASGTRRSMQTRALKTAARFAEQESAALALIEKAARSGHPCPSNARLANALGFASTGAPQAVLNRLQARGAIEIGRCCSERVIRIVASGLQTAGDMSSPAKLRKNSGGGKVTRKDRYAHALSECGDINWAARMIGVAPETGQRLFAEICADLGEQAQ